MKLTFFLRIRAKKKKLQEVPVYVRLRDESVDILQKTFLMVAPEKWDPGQGKGNFAVFVETFL